MGEILEEFKIVFGFDDKPLQDGIKKTENTIQGLGKVFGSLVAGFASFQAIKAATVDFANFNNLLDDNTSILGLNIEEVSALGGALERFGGNTDSAISSLRSLSGHLEEAKKGSGALIEVSKRYGISFKPFASANDTLLSLSKQMGRFSAQQRLAIAQQLGLDDSLTRAFADGGKELEKQIERQKRWGTITKEDVKISKQFNDAQLDLKSIFSALTRDFARIILPSFTKLVEIFSSFIEWVRDHKQLVVLFFTGLAVAMSPVLILFGQIALAALVAFAPIYKAIGTIMAISLVIEDIYYYFKGWDSVTGDLVNRFPAIGILLEGIKPIVVGIFNTFDSIVSFLKDPSWENLGNIFKTIGNALLEFITKPFDAFMNTFSGWIDSIKNLGNMMGNWFSGEGANINQNIIASAQGLQASQVPLTPQVPLSSSTTNNQTGSNYNINNNFNQNINTATPKQFADSTNSQIVNSITDIRQQNGAL